MLVGVLALQGAFREHRKMLTLCGADSLEVRKPEQLLGLDGVIIPGGESTTIGKLLVEWRLIDQLRDLGNRGVPIFGTCAGLVLLAKEIAGSTQPRIGMMDISAVRNAFGRQVDSFERDLTIKGIGETPFRAVFIRAPSIRSVAPEVAVLAEMDGQIVMARQGNLLVSAFHPELTTDTRVHRYFLEMIAKKTA